MTTMKPRSCDSCEAVMWPSCDHHVTLVSCNHHVTIVRLCHVTIMWLLWGCHVTIMWLLCDCVMWLSCDYCVAVMWPSCDYCVAVMWHDTKTQFMWPLLTTYPRTVLFSWQSMCVSVLCEWVELCRWVVLWLCFPHLLSVEYTATSVTPPIEITTHITCRSGHECVNDNKVLIEGRHNVLMWLRSNYRMDTRHQLHL